LYKQKEKPMVEIEKKYWFYILPHVYCCIKDVRALLYNTQTGENMETCVPEIMELLYSLHEKKNLGCIQCDGKTLEREPYQSFLIEFCQKGMGNLSDVEQMPEKPIQLMPVLNLQRDVEKLVKEQDSFMGEDVFRYLFEVNIYLNSNCMQECPFCGNYFRQSLCCTKNKTGKPEEMTLFMLQNILSQIRYGNIGKINLLGGNILKYSYYGDFENLLSEFENQIHIWVHYANFASSAPINSVFQYDIPVTFPVDETAWSHCIALMKDKQAKYHFFITGLEDYEVADKLIARYELTNYSIHPIYTKHNKVFFEENIYTSRAEIFQSKHAFRQIFARQKLNTWFFGSLTISFDGNVYANINKPVLGNIEKDRLLNIVEKEMIVNTAWRKIRDVAPCDSCLYQYLCPSPSNYEWVMEQTNLCNIIK
jgi:pseudo-rSAM protein